MTNDRRDAPTHGHTYNGFAGPPRDEPLLRFDGRPPPSPQRRDRRPMIVAGVAGALGLGILVGLLAQPDLVTNRDDRPMAPVTAAPNTEQMKIAVAPPVAPPTPEASESDAPLEVLPPEYADAAQARAAESRAAEASARAPVLSPPAPVREVEIPPASRTAPTPPRARTPAEPAVVAVAPPPPAAAVARPSFNCAYAGTRAERMVCSDPELAAADRRLARAFRRATDSGVPYRALRAEQDDWLGIREDAARRSPEAVASIYEQRIEELNAMAREGY